MSIADHGDIRTFVFDKTTDGGRSLSVKLREAAARVFLAGTDLESALVMRDAADFIERNIARPRG